MAKGFKHGGGGGTSLNFKVVGNPQPASPKENTIWLNTDVEIGKWHFDATQPEGLEQGDVWFTVGTYSPVEFNALKKNGIQVYPQSAKQYVGGAWVDVEAKIYQGGKWADWATYLYINGDECTDITAGWNINGYSRANGIFIGTKYSNYMRLTGDNARLCILGTYRPINLDNYNTLYVDAQPTGTDTGNRVSISVFLLTSKSLDGGIVGAIDFGNALVRSVKTLDISNLSGELYVVVAAQQQATCSGNVYGVWLS